MTDPALLAAISDLEFVARVTVEGTLAGLHRSPFHGYSAEFSQYRHYHPGDDLKYVDWKLFARTDRVYTKQFRETTNARVQLVIDASASMAFAGTGGVTKFAYARMLAAALAHLLVQQGDAVGLAVVSDRIRTYVGCRPGRGHLRRILTDLRHSVAEGPGAPAAPLRRAVDLLPSRGAVILLSDLYDEEDAADAELRRAVRIGHDVSVFHVLTSEEQRWRWPSDVELEDSETGRRVLSSSSDASGYQARVAAFLARWKERCAASAVPYVLTATDSPPAHHLRSFLLTRAGGRA